MSRTESMTIGTVAEAAEVGRETIRFYEREGLIDEPPRSSGGYRLYPPSVVRRLRFIRRAQELGFTLTEIGELLDLRAENAAACDAVEARARGRLADIEARIRDLERIGDALTRLVKQCAARQPTGECPILEELDDRAEQDVLTSRARRGPDQGRGAP